jgi:hypothetical protein
MNAATEGRGFAGHWPVRHGKGDWRCNCGVRLGGGPYGDGRIGARDVMRFHRADLGMATRGAAEVSR